MIKTTSHNIRIPQIDPYFMRRFHASTRVLFISVALRHDFHKNWASTSYKYPYNSAYRGYNLNYPFVTAVYREPHATAGNVAPLRFGNSCKVLCWAKISSCRSSCVGAKVSQHGCAYLDGDLFGIWPLGETILFFLKNQGGGWMIELQWSIPQTKLISPESSRK